ncbi:MAG: sigma-70 family RNA polymerase sigma factor, partial [Lachnospiraceae bacterium]|nr:sigma-70 family RNA polymerase sigma factor [Lachnospiraceae bacterium]
NTQTKTYDKEQVYTEYYPKVLRYVENRSSVRMDAEDELERLADALETLSTEERDLIILHYYNGETLLYIAELMRRPYGQIKRLHVKALKKLRKQMGMESMRLYTGIMQVSTSNKANALEGD